MKYFIVSEDDLRILIDMAIFSETEGYEDYVGRTTRDFLADKQPVEMVAEGEVKQVFNNGGYHSAIGEYNTNVYFDKYEGKSIKIFIQEGK